MNVETGEIKNIEELSDEEKESGKWNLIGYLNLTDLVDVDWRVY